MDKLTIIYSSDGYNWNAIVNDVIPETNSSNSLYSMDSNKDRVMVVGYRNILYSDNLIDWYQCLKALINDNYKRFTDITWTESYGYYQQIIVNNFKNYIIQRMERFNNANNGTILQDTFIMKLGCKNHNQIYIYNIQL